MKYLYNIFYNYIIIKNILEIYIIVIMNNNTRNQNNNRPTNTSSNITQPVQRAQPPAQPVQQQPVQRAQPPAQPVQQQPVQRAQPPAQPVQQQPVQRAQPPAQPVQQPSAQPVQQQPVQREQVPVQEQHVQVPVQPAPSSKTALYHPIDHENDHHDDNRNHKKHHKKSHYESSKEHFTNQNNNINTCNKTSNNKYLQCPALMADGRAFTDYRPSSDVENMIQYSNNIMSSYQYRQFLIHNANQIMDVNSMYTNNKLSCNNCTAQPVPFNTVCDVNSVSSKCQVVNPNGIGIYYKTR